MTDKPRALVTGASSGVGEHYARHLARMGHDLVLVARRQDRLEALATELREAHGTGAEVIAADLGDAAGLATVVRRIAEGGPLAMVINNAGYASRGLVAELDLPAFDAMLRVNITALTHLAQAAMARFLAAGAGTIVNVSSGTNFSQRPGNAGYAATKSFVTALTRHMQVEAAGSGVRVQLLVPGLIDTEFHDVSGQGVGAFPPERVMQAEDVVIASLRALEMGELVCLPSLPEITDWDDYVAAERQVSLGVSRDRLAPRYHPAG